MSDTQSKEKFLQLLSGDPQHKGESLPAAAPSAVRKWLNIIFPLIILGLLIKMFWLDGSREAVLTDKPSKQKSNVITATETTPESHKTVIKNKSLLDSSGYVVARRKTRVTSKVLGKVERLYVEEGDHIEIGQTLARLDNSKEKLELDFLIVQLQRIDSDIEKARIQITKSEEKYRDALSLKDSNFISTDALNDLKYANEIARVDLQIMQQGAALQRVNIDLKKQALRDMVILSPFSGTIVSKNVQVGEVVSPTFTQTGIYTLVDMSSLEIEVDVNEDYIDRVVAGGAVEASINAYPNEPLEAEVIAIIPTADRTKETIKVRIKILELNDKILPDMAVRVKFLDSQV